MSKVFKVTAGILVLLVIVLGAFAGLLAHDSGAAPAEPLPAGVARMKAIVYRQYGSPAVLHAEVVARPVPAANELLIRVRAASLNPLDWHFMRGTPYVVRMQMGLGHPKSIRLGVDFAGTVEAVGAQVRQFKPGDAIFGTADGTLAQYATSTEAGLALKPVNMSFEQAAAVPVAAVTALQGLRNYGHLRPGQKLLVNGASGGVGTFAVQIGRALGAEVTGVCSTRNLELVHSLGADHLIDYTREDFTRGGRQYDLILDTVGNHALRDYERILTPGGIVVLLGSPSYEPWLGPLVGLMRARLLAPFLHHPYVSFFADTGNTADFNTLRDWMQAGKLVPVIDRHYPLAQAAQAMQYLEAGHTRGKVVVSVD